MVSHTSASVREHTPQVNRLSRTNTFVNALKRRAQAVLNDTSIDAQTRAIIRYGLETNDPWLAELVRRADAGETVIDDTENIGDRQDLETENECNEEEIESSQEKIEALAELICRAGDEPAIKSAALVVLMASLENATHPKALANTVKHLAFACCGELNFCGMVEAQVAVFETELLARDMLMQ